MHASVFRLRRVQLMLAIADPLMLPSAKGNDVDTLLAHDLAAQGPARMRPCQHFYAAGPRMTRGPDNSLLPPV